MPFVNQTNRGIVDKRNHTKNQALNPTIVHNRLARVIRNGEGSGTLFDIAHWACHLSIKYVTNVATYIGITSYQMKVSVLFEAFSSKLPT